MKRLLSVSAVVLVGLLVLSTKVYACPHGYKLIADEEQTQSDDNSGQQDAGRQEDNDDEASNDPSYPEQIQPTMNTADVPSETAAV